MVIYPSFFILNNATVTRGHRFKLFKMSTFSLLTELTIGTLYPTQSSPQQCLSRNNQDMGTSKPCSLVWQIDLASHIYFLCVQKINPVHLSILYNFLYCNMKSRLKSCKHSRLLPQQWLPYWIYNLVLVCHCLVLQCNLQPQ